MINANDTKLGKILCSWPGKSPADSTSAEHPALYHLLDVAAVAEVLVSTEKFSPELKEALVALVALHDLGKIHPIFRSMLRDGVAQSQPHWQITEAYLRVFDSILAEWLGADRLQRFMLYAATAGHHGRPPDLEGREMHSLIKRAGDGKAAAEWAVMEFRALWPDASLRELTDEQALSLSWWLPGLCSTADWIGSNTKWFAAKASTTDLPDYLEEARQIAPRAVAEAGLTVARPSDKRLFDFAFRPMQEAARAIDLPVGPVLALIEDETGAGKTEAALLLAQRLLQAGKGRGIYFALPTMATADAMFERARKVIGAMFDTSPSLTLAHGRAALSEQFKDLVVNATSSPGEANCSEWLAESRKRALLSTIGVGTVDQAFLAALPVKFQTLRHYALASKVLIIDEVHELGDPYLATELEVLLKMHRRAGGSAILLTATLPLEQRKRLLDCYDGEASDPAYPALTIARGQTFTKVAALSGGKGPVEVRRISSQDEAISLIENAKARGAASVWVRNAVDDAIDAVRALHEAGVDAALLHARFALCDRKRIEAEMRRSFGRHGEDRAGRVLVGTQILESSLDLDFDVMLSDLAPIAGLIQRAGRLWRHMAERPAHMRPVPGPILHVLSPDPERVICSGWLFDTQPKGGFVYPLSEQWRTAELLRRTPEILAPEGLRDLIEAVHGADPIPLPEAVLQAELKEQGEKAAARGHAQMNVIDLSHEYRLGARAFDDAAYPTRLGKPQQVLVLARREGARLVPWAGGEGPESWMLSEVSVARNRLTSFSLPDQNDTEIREITEHWPDWKRAAHFLCPVAEDGQICAGLRYSRMLGLLFG